ncbi:MAG TPA: MFS transporter, partial [Actinomycetes bacterium]|nr:MFS transporter [Actinomycetes bacterium]
MSSVPPVRRAVPGWLGRILVALVLTQAATFLARPVTSYRALALGADERVIGLITASFAVLPLVVAVPLGRVADRRRPVGMLAAGGGADQDLQAGDGPAAAAAA